MCFTIHILQNIIDPAPRVLVISDALGLSQMIHKTGAMMRASHDRKASYAIIPCVSSALSSSTMGAANSILST